MQKESIIWDAHSCVALSKEIDLSLLKKHHRNGARYISINVGMDMNPLEQVIELIAVFQKQIEKYDFMSLVSSISDVDKAVKEDKLAVSFDLEGAMCCKDNPDIIYLLNRLNVKQIHLAYNRNNSLAGGCHDNDKGLTKLGKKFVDAINDCGIFMDVSHTGYKTSMDIFNYSDKPVIYSHANPYGLVNHQRNIKDEQIISCANTGGIICLNGVGHFLGDVELKSSTYANHIDYVVGKVGVDRVGIGLDYCYEAGKDDMPKDFNAEYWWPKSAGYKDGLSMNYASADIFLETIKQLQNKGYTELDIEKIMFKNMYNLASKVWKNK